MERLNKIKGVIFDLDGTLLDSLWIWESVDRALLAKFGIQEMPSDFMEQVNSLGFYESAVYIIERFNLSISPESIMLILQNMICDIYKNEVKLKPFAKDYLVSLKSKGIKLGLATCMEKNIMELCLNSNDILDYFDAKVTSSDIKKDKNSADIYLECARLLDLESKDIAVFEDISVALKTARNANFLTVGVYDKYSLESPEQIKSCCDIYINDFNL